MKFEGDRTSIRSGAVAVDGPDEGAPAAVGAGAGMASRRELRARARTSMLLLGSTIDRSARLG